MPSPQASSNCQHLLGMINFMQPFVPHILHLTKLLRKFWKKRCILAWDEVVNQVFQWLKVLMSTGIQKPLQYFSHSKPHPDTSSRGLHTCHLLKGQPIAFASKCLTDIGTCYVNMNKELLSVVFICTRQGLTHTCGRSFEVKSEHRSL